MKKTVNGIVFIRSKLKGYWYSPMQLTEYSDTATVQYFVRKHKTLETKYVLSCQYSDEKTEWTLNTDSSVGYLLRKAADAIVGIKAYREAN